MGNELFAWILLGVAVIGVWGILIMWGSNLVAGLAVAVLFILLASVLIWGLIETYY